MFRGRAVRVCVRAFVLCAVALTWSWRTDVRAQAPYSPTLYSGLSWRMLGPFRGGRVDAVSGVPGRPHEFYFGAVNGGVWKTIDGGRVWRPIFDSQPVASIGALAVAPSAPDTIYVGTGESTLRDSMGYGNGVYKSIDAGQTWTHIGLDDTQHIGKIAVDPRNPNVVFVAAIGHLYEAHPDRGVFRSERRWQELEEGALQERQRRRGGRRHRSDEFTNRVRLAVEHAPSALVHLRTDERAGRRHLQVDRRRYDVDVNSPTACLQVCREDRNRRRAEQPASPVRGRRRLPSGGCAPDSPCPGRPRVAAQVRQLAQPVWGEVADGAADRRTASTAGGAQAGRLLPLRRRRRDVDEALGRQRSVGSRLVFREARSSTRRNADIVYVPNVSRRRDRRTAARRGSRSADRPAATTTISRGSRRTTRTR